MIRIRVGVGRRGGIRPGDLVGAIANEAGIDAKAIGAIDIADNFSLVEVDEAVADRVVAALSRVWLRGQRAQVSRDSDGFAGASEPRRPRPHRGAASRSARRGKAPHGPRP